MKFKSSDAFSRFASRIYSPYIPLMTHNKICWGEGWQRPDRKDCASLCCVNGEHLTLDEYNAKYDDMGNLRVPATPKLEDDPLYVQACEDCPQGMNCARCGGKNQFYDDCGWFYFFEGDPELFEESLEVAVCKACFDAGGGSTSER